MGDQWEIIEVLNRYAEACDRRDWNLLYDVFTGDVVSEYGQTASLTGRAERVADIRLYLEGCGPTQHLLGNYSIRVDGSAAESTCYVRAFHVGDTRPDLTYEMFGAYHDRLIKSELGWRIAHRRLEVFFERGTHQVLGRPRHA